jgi:hypothetical protein
LSECANNSVFIRAMPVKSLLDFFISEKIKTLMNLFRFSVVIFLIVLCKLDKNDLPVIVAASHAFE